MKTHIKTTYLGRPVEVDVASVTHFSSGDKYVTAHCHDNEYLISRTLDGLEDEYGCSFVRTHRSWLVRKSLVEKVVRGYDREYYAKLLDGRMIPASRRRRHNIAQELAK